MILVKSIQRSRLKHVQNEKWATTFFSFQASPVPCRAPRKKFPAYLDLRTKYARNQCVHSGTRWAPIPDLKSMELWGPYKWPKINRGTGDITFITLLIVGVITPFTFIVVARLEDPMVRFITSGFSMRSSWVWYLQYLYIRLCAGP